MIPTIEDIVAAVAAGTMNQREAVAHIQSHLELAQGDLRELFASQAMTALIRGSEPFVSPVSAGLSKTIAEDSFAMADAMLEVRKQRPLKQ